jgi:hypothetical protein
MPQRPPVPAPSSPAPADTRPPGAEEAILSLIGQRAGKTICPTEAARLVGGEAWRRALPLIRQTAVHLARTGQIAIYRHNKPVDPGAFKGVYRLGPPTPVSAELAPDGTAPAA